MILPITSNHHLRSSEERNEKQRRTKVSFSRTVVQALELLQLLKRTSQDEAMSNSAKIKPVALVVIGASLSEPHTSR